MDVRVIVLIVAAVCLPLAAYLWFRIFNSADGERYMKRRMQGPFVPLSAEDDAADNAPKP